MSPITNAVKHHEFLGVSDGWHGYVHLSTETIIEGYRYHIEAFRDI